MMASRLSFWSNILVFSLVLAISAAENEPKEFVVTLDHSNFSETIGKHNFIVVEFYAPWCGHCKKLAPEYEKAASILSRHDPPVILAKVDAYEEANRELASQYEIGGFPTLKILRNGGKSVQEYKGPRDAEGIAEYLKKQNGPASAEIKSAEDATALIGDKKITIVGVFPKFSGEEFENYSAVAEKLRSDYDFGHTLDAKHLPRGELSVPGPLVRLFKPFDELFVDFKDFNVDVLEKFIEESSIPIVTVLNNDPSNHPFLNKFFNHPDAKAMMFLNFSSENADSFKTKYHEIAEQYKGQGVIFLIGDIEASQNAFQYFGLKESHVPLVIILTSDGQKYLKANVKPDHVAPWVKDFKDGKLPRYIKSEPIPEVNDEPVKIVVGDSLQDMVFNSGKNVLLEFYSPMCGHCKMLAPILDEVAISYESDADVVIAKFDGTANDIPRDIFELQGYPTLFLRTPSGNLVEYKGDRTKDDIIGFIEKNREKVSQEQQEQQAKKDEL